MRNEPVVYVIGTGAVGIALAAILAKSGRQVVAVTTSRPKSEEPARIAKARTAGGESLEATVPAVALSQLEKPEGILAVTAKAHANSAIARTLAEREFTGPLVVLQNGIGVEQPFLDAGFPDVHRCVLYMTSQIAADGAAEFRSIASCPIGAIAGSGSDAIADVLCTRTFPFHPVADIRGDVWKKTIINSVFNSICPLLDIDNGIFWRDAGVLRLAREVVAECTALAARRGVELDDDAVIDQILKISRGSDGQPISTLQDLRAGRQTEIEHLNLELARMAEKDGIDLTRTRLLGEMIRAKSGGQKKGAESAI